MTTAGSWSNRCAYNMANAYLGSGTFYAIVTTTSATAAAARDYNTLDDVTTALTEASGTGYARKTVTWNITEDDTNDWCLVTISDLEYTAPSGWVLGAVWIFKQAGASPSTTDELVMQLVDDTNWPASTDGTSVVVEADATTGVGRVRTS